MGTNGTGLSTYASILRSPDAGAIWLHVQLPTGPLARGPYGDLEEAQRAAAALERVARRRWAQDKGEPGDIGGQNRVPAPQAWTTGDCGKESHRRMPNHRENFPFPRILADLLRTST